MATIVNQYVVVVPTAPSCVTVLQPSIVEFKSRKLCLDVTYVTSSH